MIRQRIVQTKKRGGNAPFHEIISVNLVSKIVGDCRIDRIDFSVGFRNIFSPIILP
jgi:hypothetical protein